MLARYEAKKAKNFAEADRIRDELKRQVTAIEVFRSFPTCWRNFSRYSPNTA